MSVSTDGNSNEEKFKAMKSIDDMLTHLWLNALLCTNSYYDTRIFEMETAEDFSKWRLFQERIK